MSRNILLAVAALVWFSSSAPVHAQLPFMSDWNVVNNGFGSLFSQLTGSPAQVQLPPRMIFDPFTGFMQSQFPFATEFAVSVEPNSSARGCQLVTNNPRFTGVMATTLVQPTQFESQGMDSRPGRANWRMYVFSINNNMGANIVMIQTTFWRTMFPTNCQYELMIRGYHAVPLGAVDPKVVAEMESGPIKNEQPPKAFAMAAAPVARGAEKIEPPKHEGKNLNDKIDLSKAKIQ